MNTLGQEAEIQALAYLKQQGLKHITSNYQCRYGEIDLIMQEAKTIVFVEVRMRKSQHFGGAALSITSNKQQKLIHTAQHYLLQHGNSACRFDAILMTSDKMESIEWIKNAFEA